MANSPIYLNGSSFKLDGIKERCFYSLGTQSGNKGITHTCYMSKKVVEGSVYKVDPDLIQLSGVCKYTFIKSGNVICGVLVLSPTSLTKVLPFTLTIHSSPSDEESKFLPRFDLQPQGIIVCQSDDDAIILVGEVESNMLVRVDA